ncbi:MAG: hypothetical protein ACREX3_09580 [Gammaproteobacteria bacterium]
MIGKLDYLSFGATGFCSTNPRTTQEHIDVGIIIPRVKIVGV